MSLNAKLVVVGGDVKTAEIKLRLPSTIGRGRGTTIMLPHPLVSRQHCELFESNGKLMVRDTGSLNGTFINNERITEAPLMPGELLTVGTVTFRAVFEDLPDNGAPGVRPTKTTRPGDTDPEEVLATINASGGAMAAAPPSEPVELDGVDELGEDLGFGPGDLNKTDTLEDEDHSLKDAAPPATAAPVAKPAPPFAIPAAAPAKPAAPPTAIPPAKAKSEAEEEVEADAADEEDDLNDFLKSLGNK